MYEVPEKRVLGSRLRRLAAQGKLEKVSQLKSGVSLEKPCVNINNKKAKTLPCVPFLVGFLMPCFVCYVLVLLQTTDAELVQDE